MAPHPTYSNTSNPHTSRPGRITVETLEDEDLNYFTPSTTSSPTTSSRNSLFDVTTDEEDVEEVVRHVPPPCRLDGVHEIALSLFGCVPPKNFGRVLPGVYRSAFPQRENLSFLKTLGLNSILTLVPEAYSHQHNQYVLENGIHHFRIRIPANKDPFVVISQCDMAAALGVVLDRSNHPLLIHCNKGKHRTGTVVGCVRKVMGWDMERVCAEYRRYAGAKARVLDERFMDMFDERGMLWLARFNGFISNDEPITESPISALSVGSRLRG